MSYCRFSSDNWKSDCYSYESDHGFITHVACFRHVGDIPPMADPTAVDVETFAASYRAHMDAVAATTKVPIGLPADGENYCDMTLADLAERLLWLRGLGYHVPESALEEIRAEMAEEGSVP